MPKVYPMLLHNRWKSLPLKPSLDALYIKLNLGLKPVNLWVFGSANGSYKICRISLWLFIISELNSQIDFNLWLSEIKTVGANT